MKFSVLNENVLNSNSEKTLQAEELSKLKYAAMRLFMKVTGVYRIHSKADMREFLFRLAISFMKYHPIESWHSSGEFFMVENKGKQFVFGQEDVENHFGIEVIDSLDNYCSRAVYLRNADILLKAGNDDFLGARLTFEEVKENKNIPSSSAMDDSEFEVDLSTVDPIIAAEAFADDIVRTMPTALWQEKVIEIRAKKQEIIIRKAKVSLLPAFDITSIPVYLVKKCAEVIYTIDKTEAYMQDDRLFDLNIKPLVYLAWLQANGHLTHKDDGWYNVTEGYELCFSDYIMLVEGGIFKILTTYSFEHLWPHLKVT